jgi:fermentation-respiration switch protein FrsA (DUF1100 family)
MHLSSRRLCALAFLAFAVPVTACSAQLTERQLLRPVAAGTLTQESVSAVAPAYTATRHTIVAADGTKLHSVLLRQPRARGTILYFGGNGYTIGRFGAATAAIVAPLGMNLMLVDHRGYGLSEGVPSADTIETDGLAAFDYLARLPGMTPDRIVVHGQSLGSFIAGRIAANRPTAGVVLESSVTTTEDWVASQTAGKPVKVTIDPPLRGRGNLRQISAISEPLLLLVGRNDTTTPPRLSEALYGASPLPPSAKTLAIIPGAGHNDALLKPEAMTAYRTFLARALR